MANIAQCALALADSSASTFQFHAHAVRVVVIDGEPWFVCTDVAKALAYRDANNAARCLSADQKGTHNLSTLSSGERGGGDQCVTIINESGLYRLVLRSRKPEAVAFSDWVTGEVLPSIRKTGSYGHAGHPAPSSVKDSYALAAALLPEIAEAIQSGLEGTNRRWFLTFDYHHKPFIRTIPDDAYMMSHSDLLKHLLSPDGSPLKNAELEAFIHAATRQLASRANRLLPGAGEPQ